MAKEPSPRTWVHFLAGASETALRPLTTGRDGRLSRYRVQEVIPVRGESPANLAQGWSVVRIETLVPISLPEEALSPSGSPVIQFHGVTQHLQYTSGAQRQELDGRSVSELKPSDQAMAVLVPIGKSKEWWKLAHDQSEPILQYSL